MCKVEADGKLTSFNAVKMHGKEVNELRYADDTVLFAQKPEELRRLLQSVKTHSDSSGLYLNAKKTKTKIMDLDKSPTTTIDVDGEQLENVNNFVYLGSRIDADGKSSPDIRRHIKRHNTLEKLFLEGTCEGRRGRGRPRRRWTQDIGEWMGVSTVEAGRQALERGEFRQAVWEATSI